LAPSTIAASPDAAMSAPISANLAVLDQQVPFGEVADLGIESEENSPLDEDPSRTLQARKCCIASILGAGGIREGLSGDATGKESGAGPQQRATRRARNPARGFVGLGHVDLPVRRARAVCPSEQVMPEVYSESHAPHQAPLGSGSLRPCYAQH
jgi:hypothetical protein